MIVFPIAAILGVAAVIGSLIEGVLVQRARSRNPYAPMPWRPTVIAAIASVVLAAVLLWLAYGR